MKSFDEWFDSQDIDNWTNKKFMLKAYEAGQQSKQAEIDELKLINFDSELNLDAAKDEIKRLNKIINEELLK